VLSGLIPRLQSLNFGVFDVSHNDRTRAPDPVRAVGEVRDGLDDFPAHGELGGIAVRDGGGDELARLDGRERRREAHAAACVGGVGRQLAEVDCALAVASRIAGGVGEELEREGRVGRAGQRPLLPLSRKQCPPGAGGDPLYSADIDIPRRSCGGATDSVQKDEG